MPHQREANPTLCHGGQQLSSTSGTASMHPSRLQWFRSASPPQPALISRVLRAATYLGPVTSVEITADFVTIEVGGYRVTIWSQINNAHFARRVPPACVVHRQTYTELRMEALASEFRPERVETRTVYVQGTVIQVSVVKDPLSLSIPYFVQMGSTCENRIISCQL